MSSQFSLEKNLVKYFSHVCVASAERGERGTWQIILTCVCFNKYVL